MLRNCLAIVVVAVAAMLVPSVASAAKSGTYVGKDEGQVKVVMKVKNNRVVSFKGIPGGSCYGSYMLVAFTYPSASKDPKPDPRIKKSGLFTLTFKGSPNVSFNDDQRTLTGRIKGNKVTGRMLVGGLCQVDAKFTAKLKK